MGFYHHYLATALNIIAVYNGDKPLEFHLKKYYSLNKKHGSKDRKVISDICYSYFRAAQAFGKGLNEENIINCFFLHTKANTRYCCSLSQDSIPG